MTRPQAFACIAYFGGTENIEPQDLDLTLAMCSENSIFVSNELLSDPFDTIADSDICRIVGSIDRPGTCMLIAPQDSQVRPLSNEYNLVTHAQYNGHRENHFQGTSLHLSFTSWSLPLESCNIRTIDHNIQYIESVISVLDRGKWVADLDILRINFDGLLRIAPSSSCPSSHAESQYHDYTSIDNWEELLDGPETVGIFRANGNWAARLAAVSILSQRQQGHAIGVFGRGPFCLRCHEEACGDGLDLPDHVSRLPSICID